MLSVSSRHVVIGALEFPNSKSRPVTYIVTRVANPATAIHIGRDDWDVHPCETVVQIRGAITASIADRRRLRLSRSSRLFCGPTKNTPRTPRKHCGWRE